MNNIENELAVQSFCFRNFKENEEVADSVRNIGLKGIELCAVHFDFSEVEKHKDIVNIYHKAGVEIVSTGVNTLTAVKEEVEPYFKFSQAAGAKHMSVNFKPDGLPAALKLAVELAEKYDIKLGIHNHGGQHWLGNSEILRYIFNNFGERIGLCLDTAWALDAGEDPVAMAREFSDRLYCVHFKDFLFDNARNPEDVVVGQGNLDLKALYQFLDEIDYDGISVLEYEGDVENPVTSLHKCVEAMKE